MNVINCLTLANGCFHRKLFVVDISGGNTRGKQAPSIDCHTLFGLANRSSVLTVLNCWVNTHAEQMCWVHNKINVRLSLKYRVKKLQVLVRMCVVS